MNHALPLLLIFLLLSPLLSAAETPELQDPPEVDEVQELPETPDPFSRHLSYQAALEIELGLQLYQEGDDYRAITSLKRHRLLRGSTEADHLTSLIIADIYRRNAYAELSMQHFFDAAESIRQESTIDHLAAYHMGIQELCVSLGSYAGCYQYLVELERAYGLADYVPGAELVRYHRHFVEFLLGAKPLPMPPFSDPRLQRASDEFHTRSLAFSDLPQKRPALAGLLSALLPGAGQAYNGRWLDAALAFGFTGALGAAAVYSYFGLESIPLTVATGFFTLGFYTGNIANAVVDARRINAETLDDYFQALHEDLWPRQRFQIRGNRIEYDYRFDWPAHVEPPTEDPEPPPIPGML